MLKKYAKIIAIGFILGISAFMPAAENNPLIAEKVVQLIKKDELDDQEKDKKNDDENKDTYMITKKLDQATQLTTVSDCTFTAEKGWLVSQCPDKIVLEEPDRELTVALIENNEDNAEQAALAAWQQIQPDFARTIQHKMQLVAQDGWDEIVQFMYDASAHENRFVFATARRVNKRWYIELIDGTKAAFDRRMAGVLLINTSFKVPGAQEESFANKKIQSINAAQLKEFTDFVEQAQMECEVPAVAIGIVQDGKIIFEQGLGVRDLNKQDKVTPQTLFMIGSTTKALTTFMMARLIDEGKFTWDTPITQIMPDFALGDEATTKQVLMKYTVSASTGIPRQDIETLFNYDQATPELRIKEMHDMKPTTGFGEAFQYSNGMVSAGGYIAAYSTNKKSDLGKAYDTAMQSYVFNPIGMKSSTLNFAHVEKSDHASPHGMNLQGSYAPLTVGDERWVESIRPAGGVWSNVHDMAQYLIAELNNGVNADGKRIISEDNLLKRREPQIKITDKMSYGLGLMTENYHGILAVGHDGMTMGFSSLLFFLPEYKTGLVVLTNARGASIFTQAVKRKFMELLFDGKAQAQKMVKVGTEQQKKMFEKGLEDIAFKPDHAWLKQFVGTYTHPTLGQIIIRETVDGAELDARVWKSALGQKKEKDGTLNLILTNGLFTGLEFLPHQNDNALQLELKSGQHSYIFERKLKESMPPQKFLFEIIPASAEETDLVDYKLAQYNNQQVPFTQKENLILKNYVIKDNGAIVAGIKAEIYHWGILYIAVLFIDEHYRNKGLGTALLNKVESDAKAVDATLVHLDTFDFQAKDFYLKHGYEIFGVLENCPKGHTRYYMKKNL